jgi:hypothetical protein
MSFKIIHSVPVKGREIVHSINKRKRNRTISLEKAGMNFMHIKSHIDFFLCFSCELLTRSMPDAKALNLN